MTEDSTVGDSAAAQSHQSWAPMAIIALGQAQISLNISALPISIGGIVADFDTAPTTVGTAIVAHSLAVAAFTMVSARLGQKFGSLRVFRISTLGLLAAMVLMTASRSVATLIAAQSVAGLAAAGMTPTLVVLIAHNYSGHQQARALGFLGAVKAIAAVAALFVAGVIGTSFGWRYAFGLVIPFSVLTLLLSARLQPVPALPSAKIDLVGAGLAALAIALISLGVDNLTNWGGLLATPLAPFGVLGLSPALVMVVAGVLGVQLFVVWVGRLERQRLMPLIASRILGSSPERAAVLAMMSIVMLSNVLTFLVPLYIQIVQGQTSLRTAVAMIPYQLSVFAAAILVVNLHGRMAPREIARYAFALVAIAMVLLAVVVNNEWSNLLVVAGLVLVGLGQGALVTLLFNVMVTASPRKLAGDVGALRGTISGLAAGVGIALASALVVGILAINIDRSLVAHPTIPPELIQQVDLDRADFVSNEKLREVMARTTATADQIDEAVRINSEARLRALKLSFLLLAGIALVVIVPAGRLPGYARRPAASDAKT